MPACRAVPIIALICFLIGAVVMQQGVVQLKPFGAEPFAVNMVAILALREVGILLTAIMVAGRSGSAFTAEIGSMKMREEIDAMRTLGIDPMDTLVLPRVLALVVALPLLTFLGDIMGLAGGGADGLRRARPRHCRTISTSCTKRSTSSISWPA